MHSLTALISQSLLQDEFLSFSEFEKTTLAKDKTHSLIAVLEIGLRLGNISQAFSLGYRCALQNLWPELRQGEWAAFCVTEDSGSHPKKIKTTVSADGVLSGSKSFVSMADRVTQLLVVAVAGQGVDRPLLNAVKLDIPLAGAALTIMPNMGMMPDVAHGKLLLKNVKGNILEGDGYLDFSKKFRMIEDAHLLMAFTSLVLSKVIRHKLDDSLIDDCMVIITSLQAIAFDDDVFSVLQLAGLYNGFEVLESKFRFEWICLPVTFKDDWMRDARVFDLAKNVRKRQRQSALEKI